MPEVMKNTQLQKFDVLKNTSVMVLRNFCPISAVGLTTKLVIFIVLYNIPENFQLG